MDDISLSGYPTIQAGSLTSMWLNHKVAVAIPAKDQLFVGVLRKFSVEMPKRKNRKDSKESESAESSPAHPSGTDLPFESCKVRIWVSGRRLKLSGTHEIVMCDQIPTKIPTAKHATGLDITVAAR